MNTVLLAMDHGVLRRSLRLLVESDPEFKVVGEVESAGELVRSAVTRKPDLILLDLTMPALVIADATNRLRLDAPSTRVMVVARTDGDIHAPGAHGLLLPGSPPADFHHALREVLAGRRYWGGEAGRRLAGMPENSTGRPLENVLTRREQCVLGLILEGHSSSEVARQLEISPRTAETHRANLMRKLGVRSQTELVRLAIRRGVMPP